jgi:predicted RNase H-like HicB family nuclease
MSEEQDTIIRQEPLADGKLVYVAYDMSLPGCMAQGDSEEEALQSLAEARAFCLDIIQKRGLTVRHDPDWPPKLD